VSISVLRFGTEVETPGVHPHTGTMQRETRHPRSAGHL